LYVPASAKYQSTLAVYRSTKTAERKLRGGSELSHRIVIPEDPISRPLVHPFGLNDKLVRDEKR